MSADFSVRHNFDKINTLNAFAQAAGIFSNGVKNVCLVKCLGENIGFANAITMFDGKMDSEEEQGRCKYIRLTKLPSMMDTAQVAVYSRCYDDFKSGVRFCLKKISPSEAFYPVIVNALAKTCECFRRSKSCVTDSMERNFVAKLLFWLDDGVADLFGSWSYEARLKVVATAAKEQELLFFYFLSMLGCDVLLLQNEKDVASPKGLEDCFQSFKLGEYTTNKLPEYTKRANINPVTGNPVVVIPPRAGRRSSDPIPNIPSRPIQREQNPFENIFGSSEPKPDLRPITGRPQPPAGNIDRTEKSFEELALLASSIVMIAIHDSQGEVIGTGSGIMIGHEGFILTNNHVAAGGRLYSVKIEDDDEIYRTHEVIKYNQNLDLAIIRINKRLNPLPIYDGRTKLVRGQKVVAIGSPMGMFNSVSDGIISGFREIRDVNMIQFTAPTSHGSSGGAVLNMCGEVIGISTAGIDQAQNINLAVGFEDIRFFAGGFLK